MDHRYQLYQSLLLEWNQKMNLTAITDPAQIQVKHFLDSQACIPYIPQGANVVDVGTGAGFPGIPVHLERPDITLTLMDALNKRLDFLRAVCAVVGLSADLVHIRAEDAGKAPQYREQFDVALSRAVAALPVLAEYCLPLVKVGGLMLAMKGKDVAQELDSARPLIEKLGGAVKAVTPYTLPGTDITHSIVCIEKVAPTPSNYPRRGKKVGQLA